MKIKTLNLVTLGCSKNLVDSEKILGQLTRKGFRLLHNDAEPADIVIVNTCGFINDAKQESIDSILGFAELKKKGEVQQLFVIGCLSQRYKDELAEEIPEVDAWYGVDEPHRLFDKLRYSYDQRSVGRFITTPSHYAYLKISEGCDRSCSFCAIPLIRGSYRSVPVPELLAEASLLAEKGVRELILVAQDLSYYGVDISGKTRLVSLLEGLTEIRGIEWIRLQYLYPRDFPDGIIRLMADDPRICRYIDMPLQHINDNILRSMRRGHSKKSTIDLLQRLREQVPGVAIRTTMMVGYPGETRQAFEELKSFVREARFERLGVFAYSPEEGTRAYGLGDQVPEDEKQRRAAEIMEIQQQISSAINRERIGQTYRVIVDREEHDHFAGRTEFDSPEVDNEVILPKTEGICPGMFADVKVVSSDDFDLYGTVIPAAVGGS